MKRTVVALFVLASTLGNAQIKDSLKEKEISAVVISASRKKESIKEVPSSVTIVGKKEIQQEMTVNPDITAILQNTVPSLANTTYRTSSTGQTLRGRNVLVLIDGIPQSTPLRSGGRDLRNIDPATLDRIEVIKGATAIYGNGADGGIINYITRRPDENSKINGISQVAVTGQPFGGTLGFRVSQLLSGKKGKWDYVASMAFERTGYIKDADGVNLSPTYSIAQMNNYNGMLKIGYDITPKQRIEAAYIGYASKSYLDLGTKVGTYGVSPTIGDGELEKDPREIPQGTPRNHNVKLSYEHSEIFLNTSFSASLYYQDFRTVYGFNGARSFYNGGQSNIKSRKKGLRFHLDSRLVNQENFNLEMIYGMDILNDETAQKLEDGRFWTPNMNMTNTAPFVMAKADIGKKLIIKAGLRYENADVKVDDFYTLSRYTPVTDSYTQSIFVEGGDIQYNAFVGNVGLRYNINPFINLYTSWSQSFSINELGRILRESTRRIISELPTNPVIVNNYELGATGKVGRFFDYEFTSYVSTSKLGASYFTTADGKFDILRAPEIVYGVEGYINIHPTKWLSFGTNYSYIEGVLDTDNNGSYESKIYNARIMAPRMISYINLKPLKILDLKLTMLNNFKQNASAEPNSRGLYGYGEAAVPAYTLYNFNASYRVNKHWKVNVGVENIFNKLYQPALSWWSTRDADFSNAPGTRGMLMVEYKF